MTLKQLVSSALLLGLLNMGTPAIASAPDSSTQLKDLGTLQTHSSIDELAIKDSKADRQPSKLIIFRPKQGASLSALYYRAYIDGVFAGKLKPGQAFELSLTAGKHQLTFNNKLRSRLTFTIKPGQTKLVRGQIMKDYSIELDDIGAEQALEEAPYLAALLPEKIEASPSTLAKH